MTQTMDPNATRMIETQLETARVRAAQSLREAIRNLEMDLRAVENHVRPTSGTGTIEAAIKAVARFEGWLECAEIHRAGGGQK